MVSVLCSALQVAAVQAGLAAQLAVEAAARQAAEAELAGLREQVCGGCPCPYLKAGWKGRESGGFPLLPASVRPEALFALSL